MSTVQNPVDFMIRRTGISRNEMTAKHGLGKNLLLKACQGRVQSITPRISVVLWAEWRDRGIDQDEFDARYRTLDLDLAYHRWRVQMRRDAAKSFGWDKLRLAQTTATSPFRRLVDALGGETRAAKLLLVPDLPVSQYATGKQRVMPPSIYEALTQLRYPHLVELNKAQLQWRRNQGLDD